MSTYVWLAHSGRWDDYTVWGAYASPQSWWEDVRLELAAECPTVQMQSSDYHDRLSVRPVCRCRKVERQNRWGNGTELVHPHSGDWFDSAGLFRTEVMGYVPVVQYEHVGKRGVHDFGSCLKCGELETFAHAEDCPHVTHFEASSYEHPRSCKWNKAGERCSEDAEDGDDQFCAPHLEKVLEGRARNAALAEA